MFCGPGFEFFDFVVIGVAHVAFNVIAEFTTRTCRGRLVTAIFSGEKAACQRKIRHKPDSVLGAIGQHFAFDTALQKMIVRLHGRQRAPPAKFSQQIGFGELPGGKIGTAKIANFAGANQIVERAH